MGLQSKSQFRSLFSILNTKTNFWIERTNQLSIELYPSGRVLIRRNKKNLKPTKSLGYPIRWGSPKARLCLYSGNLLVVDLDWISPSLYISLVGCIKRKRERERERYHQTTFFIPLELRKSDSWDLLIDTWRQWRRLDTELMHWTKVSLSIRSLASI